MMRELNQLHYRQRLVKALWHLVPSEYCILFYTILSACLQEKYLLTYYRKEEDIQGKSRGNCNPKWMNSWVMSDGNYDSLVYKPIGE